VLSFGRLCVMAEYPAMPVWTDAYFADTRHLTRAQHGSYFMLLMEAWRRPNCDLPDDEQLLARLAGCTPEEWAEDSATIMAMWSLDKRAKTWTQKRLSKERQYVARKSALRRDAAASRWKQTKKTNANAMQKGMQKPCKTDAPTPIPTPTIKKGTKVPKKSARKVLETVLSKARADDLIEHRQKLKKPLTARAAELLVSELNKCTSPDGAVDMMIERGWQGIKAEWYFNAKNANQKGNQDEQPQTKDELLAIMRG